MGKKSAWRAALIALLVCIPVSVSVPTWAAAIPKRIAINVEEGAGPYARKENGRPVGLAFDVVEAIFSEANIEVDFHLMPYSRCISQVRHGHGAGCFLTAKNKAITHLFAWHKRPLLQQKMVIVVRAEEPERALTLRDLYGHRVIAVNGYTYANDFYAALPHLRIQSAVNDVNALQMLHRRRADYAILEARIMAFNLEREVSLKPLAGSFRVAGSLDPLDCYISFSKRQPHIDKIIEAFDQAHARLERSGAIANLLKSGAP